MTAGLYVRVAELPEAKVGQKLLLVELPEGDRGLGEKEDDEREGTQEV